MTRKWQFSVILSRLRPESIKFPILQRAKQQTILTFQIHEFLLFTFRRKSAWYGESQGYEKTERARQEEWRRIDTPATTRKVRKCHILSNVRETMNWWSHHSCFESERPSRRIRTQHHRYQSKFIAFSVLEMPRLCTRKRLQKLQRKRNRRVNNRLRFM